MVRSLSLLAALMFVVHPAFAESRCSQPYAPEIRDGATATKQQILDMRGDVEAFIAASDIYQDCLHKKAARNLTLIGEADRKVDDNQKEKMRVGKSYNAAMTAFKAVNGTKTTAGLSATD